MADWCSFFLTLSDPNIGVDVFIQVATVGTSYHCDVYHNGELSRVRLQHSVSSVGNTVITVFRVQLDVLDVVEQGVLDVVEHFPSVGGSCQGVAVLQLCIDCWNLNKHRLDLI